MVKYSKAISFVMGGLTMLVCQNAAFDFPNATTAGRMLLLVVVFVVFLLVGFTELLIAVINMHRREKVIKSIGSLCDYVWNLRVDPVIFFDYKNVANVSYENLLFAERKLLDFLTQPGPFVRDDDDKSQRVKTDNDILVGKAEV